jgi:FHA domain-containing protein
MDPVPAVEDAFNDLAAHQIGLLSGSRTAFYDAISQLDPARLRTRLGVPGVLDEIRPTARRAKLWAMFETSYQDMMGEAREEFEGLFQRAFSHAYEGEIDRIHSGAAR